MPIATNKLYKCPKCGYKKVVRQGDLLTPMDLNQVCPKCGVTMELSGDVVTNTVVDLMKNLFKK